MATMTISGLARAGGVGVETIRYYQRRGLLETPGLLQRGAAGGGVRRYDEAVVRRLRFIRSAQAAGFTLDQIAELLRLDATQDRAHIRKLAAVRIATLDAKIEELTSVRSALDRLARDCDRTSSGPCPIYSAFERQDADGGLSPHAVV